MGLLVGGAHKVALHELWRELIFQMRLPALSIYKSSTVCVWCRIRLFIIDHGTKLSVSAAVMAKTRVASWCHQ